MKFFTQPEKVIFFILFFNHTKDNWIFIINTSDEYYIVIFKGRLQKKASKFIEKWKLVILL